MIKFKMKMKIQFLMKLTAKFQNFKINKIIFIKKSPVNNLILKDKKFRFLEMNKSKKLKLMIRDHCMIVLNLYKIKSNN